MYYFSSTSNSEVHIFIALLRLNMLINFRNEVVVWVERDWGEATTQTVVSTVSLLRIRKLTTVGSCYTFCSSNNKPFLSLKELFHDELQYGKHMAFLNRVWKCSPFPRIPCNLGTSMHPSFCQTHVFHALTSDPRRKAWGATVRGMRAALGRGGSPQLSRGYSFGRTFCGAVGTYFPAAEAQVQTL